MTTRMTWIHLSFCMATFLGKRYKNATPPITADGHIPCLFFLAPKKSEHLYNLCEDGGEIFFPWSNNKKLQIITVIIF